MIGSEKMGVKSCLFMPDGGRLIRTFGVFSFPSRSYPSYRFLLLALSLPEKASRLSFRCNASLVVASSLFNFASSSSSSHDRCSAFWVSVAAAELFITRSRFSSSRASILSSYSSRNWVRVDLSNEETVRVESSFLGIGSGSSLARRRSRSGLLAFSLRFSSRSDLHTEANSVSWVWLAPPPNLLPSWRRRRSFSPASSLLFRSAFLALSSNS
mmetsp:Transcript_13647/g.29579  ORF Transcript_13647/g.29579 Transcript_13647/m.29579 type:complete len:213 (+) Transcript_13647:169-807(+)